MENAMKKACLAAALLLLLMCGGCNTGTKAAPDGAAGKRAVQESYLFSDFEIQIFGQGEEVCARITLDGVSLTHGKDTWTVCSSADGIRISRNGVPVYASDGD